MCFCFKKYFLMFYLELYDAYFYYFDFDIILNGIFSLTCSLLTLETHFSFHRNQYKSYHIFLFLENYTLNTFSVCRQPGTQPNAKISKYPNPAQQKISHLMCTHLTFLIYSLFVKKAKTYSSVLWPSF